LALGLDEAGEALWRRVAGAIARGLDAPLPTAERDALILDVFAWQRRRSPVIERVVRAAGAPPRATTLDAVTGVPTDAFKTARIACFDEVATARVFKTSGTTREVRGEHAFADLSLYVDAAVAMGRRWLLPEPHYRFILLAEDEVAAPHSSLTFMLARFAERWHVASSGDPWMVRGGKLDVDRARAALAEASRGDVPVALLGATFAFVHLADALAGGERYRLPPRSVAMPTGGFKGRSRELPEEELFALIGDRFGLDRAAVVQEYGMTELSSQAYEAGAPGHYVSPPWMVVTAVDAETLSPLPDGERGILRVIDLANVGSCVAIQTADLGATHPGGFRVFGRAAGATPRGCARAMDALLAGDDG